MAHRMVKEYAFPAHDERPGDGTTTATVFWPKAIGLKKGMKSVCPRWHMNPMDLKARNRIFGHVERSPEAIKSSACPVPTTADEVCPVGTISANGEKKSPSDRQTPNCRKSQRKVWNQPSK